MASGGCGKSFDTGGDTGQIERLSDLARETVRRERHKQTDVVVVLSRAPQLSSEMARREQACT